MEQNNKTIQRKSQTPGSSIFMYIVSGIIGLIGIVDIYNVMSLFNAAVKQYVSQGYAAAEVYKVLVPQQLLPGLLQPIGTYFGIAFILISAGIINSKLSKLANPLSKNEPVCTANNFEQSVPAEAVEVIEPVEVVEPAEETVSADEPVQAEEEK